MEKIIQLLVADLRGVGLDFENQTVTMEMVLLLLENEVVRKKFALLIRSQAETKDWVLKYGAVKEQALDYEVPGIIMLNAIPFLTRIEAAH